MCGGFFFFPQSDSRVMRLLYRRMNIYGKKDFPMQIYEELVARGLIAQTTDETEIRELVNAGKAVFYIGFDPTADSLQLQVRIHG